MQEAIHQPYSYSAKRTLAPAISRSDVLVGVVLIVTMLVGGYFRFMANNWDDFVRFHPDERFLSGVVSKMNGSLIFTGDDPAAQMIACQEANPGTMGRGGWFDTACSPWNPHNIGEGMYVYGTLPSFLVRWTSDLAAVTTGNPSWGGYNGVQLVGRGLSAAAETGIILIVFLMGLQLHNKWVGLLAAILYAGTVFSIQQAHFWTADAMTNFFCALAIYCAIRIQTEGRLTDYLAAGLFAGMAVAGRVNTAPIVIIIFAAAVLRGLPAFDGRQGGWERSRVFRDAAFGLIGAAVMTFLVFRVFNPYAFTGPNILGILPNERWLADVSQASYLVSGRAESPPNWQWVGRASWLFPLSNMSLWGMGILLALAGWGGWLWSLWRLIRGRAGGMQNLIPVIWVLGMFLWMGNLWVMSMRYYLPLYPLLALLAAWALVDLVQRASRAALVWRSALAWGVLVGVSAFTVLWALMFTNIYRNMFAPAEASHWIIENIPGDFAMRIEGAAPGTPLINMGVINRFGGGDDFPLIEQASRYETGQPFEMRFTAPGSGTIRSIHAPRLGDPFDDTDTESLQITIRPPNSNVVLAEGVLTADLVRQSSILGEAYDIPLSPALDVQAGETYVFRIEVMEGGPITSAGPIFTWEGDWDEPVPPKVCRLPDGMTLADNPPAGLSQEATCNGIDLWSTYLNGYKLQVVWEEETYKFDHMVEVLDNTEYLIIGTNRRYDSQNRIPYRWPMTNRYYAALFDGSLGFERVETFHHSFEFGPFSVSDQHLPYYQSPEWLNEFEAEEAFHVYDHPAVMIFRKTESYTPENTRAILGSAPLAKVESVPASRACSNLPLDSETNFFCSTQMAGVAPLYSLPADPIPTALQFPPEVRRTQYENGTWSERFDSASVINTNQAVSVGAWWLTIVVIGLAAWPILFVAFPALADRGYGLAKFGGLVLIAWVPWVLSTARLPVWSQGGILAAVMGMAVISLWLGWRNRAELGAYIRANAARLFWIEVLTWALFAGYLAIRLSNPDLWHNVYGGEKPMDFAYFNGVLRSTVFPPVDPWYAGGYINYYYYGYVTVGAPVLLLKMVPAIAYNLIIPTIFAVIGVGAFSVAFNVVSAFWERAAARPADEGGEPARPLVRLGNPWVAGIAALLLTGVFGNLDTPRVFLSEALLPAGYFNNPTGLQQHLMVEYSIQNNGAAPEGEALTRLAEQASAEAQSPFFSAWRGFRRMLAGEPLPISPGRWYWAPTRVLSEPTGGTPEYDSAIAEFPFFTFVYGDLHAHMIAMPMFIAVLGFVLHEVLAAGMGNRTRLSVFLAICFGALMVGLLRPTNTWDWPTAAALSVLGLGFAWWIGYQRRFTRNALLALIVRVGGFVALHWLVALPYLSWFATAYSSARIMNEVRTQMWMYLTVHGLFLFLLTSLLVWETGRWLRTVYVRSLRGAAFMVVTWVFIVIGLLLLTVVLAFFGIPALDGGPLPLVRAVPTAIISLPLLVWIAVLFFRTGQSREMQYVLALAGVAVALTLFVELVVLVGDIGRQNTVFKFYIQAWLIFGVVGGVAAAWLLRAASQWNVAVQSVWYALGIVLVFAAGMFPFTSSQGRAQDRMAPETPLTLDGMAYMQGAMRLEGDRYIRDMNSDLTYFPLVDDYHLIRWMQENITGTPIIMEGRGSGEYSWQSRIAIYTGLPSVVGWRFHQTQQRTFDPQSRFVDLRVANVNGFYSTLDIPTAWAILQRYDVSYVVVGNLERAYYMPEALAKFDQMVAQGLLTVVYEQGTTKLYAVQRDARFGLNEVAAGGI
jgi:YYY domain-containing protein